MPHSLCETVRHRLIEKGADALGSEERAHLESCPACYEYAGEVSRTGALLCALASEADRGGHALLSSDLKADVRDRALGRLKTVSPQVRPAFRATTNGNGLLRRARSRFAFYFHTQQGLLWSGAAVVMLFLIGVSAWRMNEPPVSGRIDFALGDVMLRQGTNERTYSLGIPLAFDGIARVMTQENSGAKMSLGDGDRVKLFLANSTDLEILSEDRISLRRGSVWLDVTPDGKGFRVETRFGSARVTGTRFGVTVTNTETRVDVTEGSVVVSQDNAKTRREITSGKFLVANGSGLSDPSARPERTALPAWIDTLYSEENKSAKGAFMPSVTTK